MMKGTGEDGCLSPVTQPCIYTRRATPGKSGTFPQGTPHGRPGRGCSPSLGVEKKRHRALGTGGGRAGAVLKHQPGGVMQSGVSLQKGCRVLDGQPRSWELARPQPGKWETPGPLRGDLPASTAPVQEPGQFTPGCEAQASLFVLCACLVPGEHVFSPNLYAARLLSFTQPGPFPFSCNFLEMWPPSVMIQTALSPYG